MFHFYVEMLEHTSFLEEKLLVVSVLESKTWSNLSYQWGFCQGIKIIDWLLSLFPVYNIFLFVNLICVEVSTDT